MLVESCVDSHIGGTHLLLGKFLHLFDGPGGSVLEADAVEPLAEIDGVLPCHDLPHCGALLLVFRRHFWETEIKQFERLNFAI